MSNKPTYCLFHNWFGKINYTQTISDVLSKGLHVAHKPKSRAMSWNITFLGFTFAANGGCNNWSQLEFKELKHNIGTLEKCKDLCAQMESCREFFFASAIKKCALTDGNCKYSSDTRYNAYKKEKRNFKNRQVEM